MLKTNVKGACLRADSATGTKQRILKNKPHFAWVMLVACCFIHLGVFGILLNTSSVFTVPVCESLGLGRGEFSMQNTMRSIASCVVLPFTAIAYRKVPIRPLVTVSALVSFVSIALMSQFTKAYQWTIASIFLGVAGAICVTTLAPTLLGNWFRKSAGFAIALASSFSGIGGSLFSPVVASIIRVFGWRKAYLIIAGGCALITLPFSMFVIRFSPRDMGMLPYGGEANEQPTEESTATNHNSKPRLLPIIMFSLSIGMVNLGSSFYQHAPSYADSIGLSASVGALLASVIMFGNVCGKLASGRLLDRFGYRRMGLLPILMSGAGIAGILLSQDKSQVLLLASTFLFGTIFCYMAVVTPFSLREIYGSTLFPLVFPIVSAIQTLLGSFGFMIHGYIFDICGSYVPALFFSLVMYFMGIVINIIFQRMKKLRE